MSEDVANRNDILRIRIQLGENHLTKIGSLDLSVITHFDAPLGVAVGKTGPCSHFGSVPAMATASCGTGGTRV
jgi:hypothetical protein